MLTIMAAGNIGSDATQKQIGESTVVEFSIAHDEKDKDGTKTTTWIRCSYWNKPALAVQKYLVKGQSVAIVGRGKVREYTKKDGGTGVSVDVNVDTLQLCGKAGGASAGAAASSAVEEPLPF